MSGHGRTYECVFCKRGFTTAQALGGHMNIHRKDRAKPTPKRRSAGSSTSTVSSNASTLAYYPSARYPLYGEEPLGFQAFYPLSRDYTPHERSFDEFSGRNSDNVSGQYTEEWGRSDLSLRVGNGFDFDVESGSRRTDEDELDLELRLGHYYR